MRLRRFTASLLLQLSLVAASAAEPGMVFIPGGEFLRGRTHKLPGEDIENGLKFFPNMLRDARPLRVIEVNPFYLDEHEVTNREYEAFTKATRRAAPFHWVEGKIAAGEENHPVANIAWDDAKAYCGWAGKRLPTEAEWERACRGMAEGAAYSWGDRAPTKQDARFDALDGPAPVCQFPKNSFGLCDMAGNVWEWTADWYEKDYYEVAPAKNPPGPTAGMYRVMRGGSWIDASKYLPCGHRTFARPNSRSPNIGFRCARNFR
jgi:formylglycine-generating enzyme required for sulfatase activity